MSIMKGAEPFFFRGNSVGCLVVHGFTGTPNEVRELGECLARDGYTVYGPRLPHHGTDPAHLDRSRFEDWYLATLDAYHVLRAQCERVIVVGFSMGGSTALLLSTRHEVTALVGLSVPITLFPDWRLGLARWIWPFHRYSERTAADDSWVDPGAPGRRVDYRRRPVRAVAELVDYLELVRAELPCVTAPLLLMHSRTDMTAPPSGMDEIFDIVASKDKERAWLEHSDHAITEDASRQEVFDRVREFIGRHAGR